ncbi:hypothetical protein M2350_002502 [Candidatus Fervidibacter sacchari]|uniref:Uncharacterized protein n=1 Tax=Candidatus Fervidibacter sacchari TaxID=1448929 RepID=A0ABT2EQF4_9BACT|nr:hypothetical protein [Candidatus Fervidibacter sacchari]
MTGRGTAGRGTREKWEGEAPAEPKNDGEWRTASGE